MNVFEYSLSIFILESSYFPLREDFACEAKHGYHQSATDSGGTDNIYSKSRL